jgi:hypothetical protein
MSLARRAMVGAIINKPTTRQRLMKALPNALAVAEDLRR